MSQDVACQAIQSVPSDQVILSSFLPTSDLNAPVQVIVTNNYLCISDHFRKRLAYHLKIYLKSLSLLLMIKLLYLLLPFLVILIFQAHLYQD